MCSNYAHLLEYLSFGRDIEVEPITPDSYDQLVDMFANKEIDEKGSKTVYSNCIIVQVEKLLDYNLFSLYFYSLPVYKSAILHAGQRRDKIPVHLRYFYKFIQ